MTLATDLSRNMRDGQMLIKDNGANSLTVDTDEGDLSIEWGAEDRVIKNRGALSHLRAGNEEPVKWSLTAKVSKVRGDDTGQGGTDTSPTIEDCFEKRGLAVGWASTGASGEPHQVKLEFKIANPNTAGRREVITLNKVRKQKCVLKEGDDYDTLELSGIANVTIPTFAWEAQT